MDPLQQQEKQINSKTPATVNASEMWDELSRMNNELLTTQRALAKQTAQLMRLNRELQREQEKSRHLLTQLQQSNQALQDFAATASHDLQAPLRKIEMFAVQLQANCSEGLNDEGRDYLERIQKVSRHMRDFVTDLLSLARVTTQTQPVEPVNLNEIAQQVVSDLEIHIQECHGQIEIGDLPIIEAEPLQMRQLMQNLIGNALKFHSPNVPPVIKVNARDITTDRFEIKVEDNGIGFDEKHLGRIFAPFQRLHGRNQYEGTGMGLAICRKIAERHGGYITAKSEPGHGTTFIITLPVRQVAGTNF